MAGDVNRWVSASCKMDRSAGIAWYSGSVVSLFVDNLPISMNNAWLRRIFECYGKIADVFVPWRLRKGSKVRFGFVRYFTKEIAEAVIGRLNGVRFLKERLIVKVADVGRQGGVRRLVREVDWKPRGSFREVDGRVTSRSFKEVLEGKEGSTMAVHVNAQSKEGNISTDKSVKKQETDCLVCPANHKIISVENIEPENVERLSKSVVGVLRRAQSLNSIDSQLQLEGIENAEVRLLGGLVVLMTFNNTIEMEEFLVKDHHALFMSVKRWSTEEVSSSRNVWLNCYGVPLNVWCPNTFHKIGSLWGEVISTDCSSISDPNLEKGRILISTTVKHLINEAIQIHLGDEWWLIRVHEEFPSGFMESYRSYNQRPKISSEESKESLNIVESVNSGKEREAINIEDNEEDVDEDVEVEIRSHYEAFYSEDELIHRLHNSNLKKKWKHKFKLARKLVKGGLKCSSCSRKIRGDVQVESPRLVGDNLDNDNLVQLSPFKEVVGIPRVVEETISGFYSDVAQLSFVPESPLSQSEAHLSPKRSVDFWANPPYGIELALFNDLDIIHVVGKSNCDLGGGSVPSHCVEELNQNISLEKAINGSHIPMCNVENIKSPTCDQIQINREPISVVNVVVPIEDNDEFIIHGGGEESRAENGVIVPYVPKIAAQKRKKKRRYLFDLVNQKKGAVRPTFSDEPGCSFIASDNTISKRNEAILKECEEVMSLGKSIGLVFQSNEEEILNRLRQMEERDSELWEREGK